MAWPLAPVALGERRRWWAAWPLWAKLAGAGTVAAAVVAGLAVLVYDPISGKSEEDVPAEAEGLTVEQAYARIRESVSRPGTILHTTIRDSYKPGEAGASLVDALPETVELWIDGEAGALRSAPPRPVEPQPYTVAGDAPYMIAGDNIYPSPSGGGTHKIDAPLDFVLCPGTTDLLLAFLLCGGMDVLNKQILPKDEVRLIASGEYDGRPGPVLEFERVQKTPASSPCEFVSSPVSGQPPSSAFVAEWKWVTRIHLDGQTFLPIAGVTELLHNCERCGTAVKQYKHEYLDGRSLPNGWLDPRSIADGGTPRPTP